MMCLCECQEVFPVPDELVIDDGRTFLRRMFRGHKHMPEKVVMQCECGATFPFGPGATATYSKIMAAEKSDEDPTLLYEQLRAEVHTMVGEFRSWHKTHKPHKLIHSAAMANVPADHFPIKVEFFNQATDELIHTINVTAPGAYVVPALSKIHGCKVRVRTTFGDGRVEVTEAPDDIGRSNEAVH